MVATRPSLHWSDERFRFGSLRMSDVGDTLVAALVRVRRNHEARVADPRLVRGLARLGEWQVRRLTATYADLQADPRYAQAMRFFETDLYGSGDFSQRDADLARVVPGMKRLLPDAALRTIASAMEANALAQDFDRAIVEALAPNELAFGVPEYCAAYRRVGRFDDRERQIRLVGEVGAALDRLVRKPMIRGVLTMMRKPAHAAGFGALQDFLERGFNAFAGMGGAAHFLATIDARELSIHRAIAAGDDAPFPDPMAERGQDAGP
jgi:hypothetical protein